MSTRRLALWTVFVLAILPALPIGAHAQGITRYVNPTDPTCTGQAPCYATIQAAVNAVLHSDTIQLQVGTYHEQVAITGKNSTSTSESDRIIIQADPAAPVGSVVLQGSVTQCTNGYAVQLQQSRLITLRGLTITAAGGQAVSMLGGNNQNQAIHLERLRIFGNGTSECNGGITINSGNPDTLVLNSLIYGNGRNGFTTLDSTGGPHYLIGNTIHGNAWSGVNVSRSHVTWLVNNAITSNGTAAGSTGGRYGVVRESSTSPDPAGIHLLNNLICGNHAGEINGPALDPTDAGNLTPTGGEGPGVTASATCAVTGDVYANVAGPDNLLNTADDDFTPVTASPLLDAGDDPRTIGLNAAFNPLLESDYLGPAARPRLGLPGGTPRFDIGAREPALADQIAPLVTFLAPAASAYVRGTVTVQAQAQDNGSGVASLSLTLDGQAFGTTLAPTIPPPVPSVTATTNWTTTTVADGVHNFVASAADAVGNHASAPLVVLVDNTPPDTQIVTGPTGEIVVASPTDAGNLTPTGGEGPGVTASATCAVTGDVYANVAGPDNLLNTADDDFTPVTASPLLDAGDDPRTIGLNAAFNPLLESDYLGPAARPRLGLPGGTPRFDIGAREPALADQIAPLVTFLAPAASAYVRGTVTVQAQAQDNGSGVASLSLTLDGQAFGTTLAPTIPPPVPSVTATTNWTTTTVADGVHNFVASAADAVGNHASAPLVVLVDNTPPDTQIITGPTGEIVVGSATFTFSGSDNLTPVGSLVFSYRLDGGAWTAFASDTTVTFPALAETSHTFAVKARDLAGNEDLSPDTKTFSVSFKPGSLTVSPSSGPIGTYVSITGINFEPGTTTVRFNGLPAVIRTITTTQITTTVPVGAASGPLTVTNSRGSGSVPFSVTPTGGFTLTAAPALPAVTSVIAGDQTSVSIAAGVIDNFTNLVSLTLSSGPSGVSASFSPSNLVAPGASVFVTLATTSALAPGTYSYTVTGQADVDGRPITATAPFTLQVLAPDTLAVTGRVLTAEAVPKPIPGVQVTLQSAFTQTDAAGNFVLQGSVAQQLTPGPAMLRVDGATASVTTAQYPVVEVQINVAASGPSRVPFVLYLPALDTAHPIDLQTNAAGFTTQDVLATTPLIPGLVVTIPANTKITGPDGLPVRQLIITPVPVDRSPMPFPPGKAAPMLFAIHPGGSVPSQPLPISFPNSTSTEPGTKADMYFFDLSIGGWNTWGTGTVNADGTQVVSDPGFGLPRLAWHWTDIVRAALKRLWGALRAVFGGDPVDLATGIFPVDKTDLVLPGRIPIAVQRSYRSDDTRQGFFGIGWNVATYDSRLTSSLTGNTLTLTTPDQNTIQLRPTAITDQWTSSDPTLLGAVVERLRSEPGSTPPIPLEFSFLVTYKDRTIHRYDRIVGFTNTAGLSAVTDRNGNKVTIIRESPDQQRFGIITRITEPAGRSLTLAYDTNGLITSVTDPIGRVVQYTYDAQRHLRTVTDPAGGVTSYTYDAQHRIVSITDPRNITYLTNEYDAQGRVSRQTQADGGAFTFAYTVLGPTLTQTIVTDPRGNVTTHRFNDQGLRVSSTDALGQTTTFEYAPGTNLLSATVDPLGRSSRTTYDAKGNIATTTDAAGNQRGFTYDTTFNRVASITNAVTPPTQFAYDASGNLTTITDPRGKNITLTYDTAGQPLTITDPLGHTVTFAYDGLGNVATRVDALANTARFEYDQVSRIVRQFDPRGRETTFGYDQLNMLRTISDAMGGVTSYNYDGNGNLLSVADARPNPATTYTYDSMDRVATRTDPLGASESFLYDIAGNLRQHTDRKGQVRAFIYDSLNRLSTSTYADGSGTSFAYDAADRLVRVDDSVGGTLTNVYDVLDRLLSQSTTLGSVSYAYDAIGRRTQLNVPGVAATTYGYDANSRVTEIMQGTQTIGLQYDDAGRRTLLSLPGGVSTQYQYDVASRLVGLVYQNSSGPLGNLTYQYDPLGNRVRTGGSLARSLLPSAITSASYDAANRQLAFGSSQMTFDPNGNLTTLTDPGGGTAFTWDARNRLVRLEQPGALASFSYAFGRRLSKTLNGAVTQYLYDGVDLVQQLEAQRTTAYLRSLSVDEIFGINTPDGSFSITADGIGSTVSITDGAGSPVTEYTYDGFGAVSATNATFPNQFQFTGRENDGLGGLYYYRARYYHPKLSRFISEDPIRFAGGDPNLYVYALSNPLSSRDPFGNVVLADDITVVAGLAAAIAWVLSPQGQQAVHDTVAAVGELIDGLSKQDAGTGAAPYPDHRNPPPNWVPVDPNTWRNPDTGEVWHWHDQPGHPGPPHWDIGGPKPGPGQKGKQDWWPVGGERGPKPPGSMRFTNCRKC